MHLYIINNQLVLAMCLYQFMSRTLCSFNAFGENFSAARSKSNKIKNVLNVYSPEGSNYINMITKLRAAVISFQYIHCQNNEMISAGLTSNFLGLSNCDRKIG